MLCAYNVNNRETEAKGDKFEASLYYIAKLWLKSPNNRSYKK